jgi:hypothetical protein
VSHFLLGAHGLALLRRRAQGVEAVAPRLHALRRLVEELDQHPLNSEVELYEMDAAKEDFQDRHR